MVEIGTCLHFDCDFHDGDSGCAYPGKVNVGTKETSEYVLPICETGWESR